MPLTTNDSCAGGTLQGFMFEIEKRDLSPRTGRVFRSSTVLFVLQFQRSRSKNYVPHQLAKLYRH